MNLTAARVRDDAARRSGTVARGFGDELSIGLTWTCHSKVGHLFPKEAYSDKGQGRDQRLYGWLRQGQHLSMKVRVLVHMGF